LKIYVGNLSFETTDNAVRDMFAAHGPVASAALAREHVSSRVRGFAFVDMPEESTALAAIAALNGVRVDGRSIVVNEASPGIAAGAGRHGFWGKAPKR
jgi:RNA recognition motif-containing protein